MFTCRRYFTSAWVVISLSMRLSSPRPQPILRHLANLSRRDTATNKTTITFFSFLSFFPSLSPVRQLIAADEVIS